MKRLTATLVALTTIGALALYGCSGSSSSASPSTAASKSVAASDWVDNLCTSLSSWQATIKNETQGATSSDPKKAKDAIVSYLEKVNAATSDLIHKVANKGTPNIPQGSAFANALVKSLEGASGIFDKALNRAHNLPTNDASKFRSEVSSLRDNLDNGGQQIGSAISNLGQRYPSAGQTLDKLGNSVPSCKSLG